MARQSSLGSWAPIGGEPVGKVAGSRPEPRMPVVPFPQGSR